MSSQPLTLTPLPGTTSCGHVIEHNSWRALGTVSGHAFEPGGTLRLNCFQSEAFGPRGTGFPFGNTTSQKLKPGFGTTKAGEALSPFDGLLRFVAQRVF